MRGISEWDGGGEDDACELGDGNRLHHPYITEDSMANRDRQRMLARAVRYANSVNSRDTSRTGMTPYVGSGDGK